MERSYTMPNEGSEQDTSSVFGSFAAYYDLLYSEKDYADESEFLRKVFQQYSQNDVRSILDIGCGTASHGVQLSLRGYDVTGFDLSHEMIALAHKKVRDAGASMSLHTMNMIDFAFDRSFDSAICMFAVLGYVTETHDLISALRNIRQHLPEGALFVFDVWNGLAVCHEMPNERMKTVTSGDIRVRRFIRPELDVVNHVCHNYYNLVVTRDDQIVQETEEVHTMRFFFPQELDYYLQQAGFRMLNLSPFLEMDGVVDETVWNISVVAQAVRQDL